MNILFSLKDDSISHITVFYVVVESDPESDEDSDEELEEESDDENQEQENNLTPVENQSNNQSTFISITSEAILVDLEDEALFEDVELEDTPLGISKLPKTGQFPVESFYRFGAMLVFAGLILKNKK